MARLTFADLARALDLPVIIVCRPGHGMVNQTALTIAAARQAGLAVAGLAICGASARPDIAERANLEELSASRPCSRSSCTTRRSPTAAALEDG